MSITSNPSKLKFKTCWSRSKSKTWMQLVIKSGMVFKRNRTKMLQSFKTTYSGNTKAAESDTWKNRSDRTFTKYLRHEVFYMVFWFLNFNQVCNLSNSNFVFPLMKNMVRFTYDYFSVVEKYVATEKLFKSNFPLIRHWEMKSSYFPPTFEFWNWGSDWTTPLKWSHLKSRRFSIP